MSVESKIIVMLAYDIGKEGWDKIEEVDERLQDSDTLVVDGMCGNYYKLVEFSPTVGEYDKEEREMYYSCEEEDIKVNVNAVCIN